MKINVMALFLSFPCFYFTAAYGEAFLPKTFRAKFQQVYKSTLSGKEKRGQGVIEYQYSGRIRLELKNPEKITFVSNSKKTWYYNAPFVQGEPGTLTIGKAKETGIAGGGPAPLFDLLRQQGLTSNDVYGVKRLPKEHRYQLTFSPDVAQRIGVAQAVLTFEKGHARPPRFPHLESITIGYVNRRPVTLHLTGIEKGITFPSKHFDFTPPPNTRLTGHPR